MSCKWHALLGVGQFYTAEEVLKLLTNMSDLKMNLPLKVKMKVILLTLLKMHLNNNIRLEPIGKYSNSNA